MITAQEMVRREVHQNVSFLISTLASGHGCFHNGAAAYEPGSKAASDIENLTEQAAELCYPVEDWQEAAEQEGWYLSDGGLYRDVSDYETMPHEADDWLSACEACEIDPYQWEIFEHWIVSGWLADRLEEQGERIDKDFAGLCIWGRTTTGQSIYMDSVIEKIHAAMIAA